MIILILDKGIPLQDFFGKVGGWGRTFSRQSFCPAVLFPGQSSESIPQFWGLRVFDSAVQRLFVICSLCFFFCECD